MVVPSWQTTHFGWIGMEVMEGPGLPGHCSRAGKPLSYTRAVCLTQVKWLGCVGLWSVERGIEVASGSPLFRCSQLFMAVLVAVHSQYPLGLAVRALLVPARSRMSRC